jgi:hypothetical protein
MTLRALLGCSIQLDGWVYASRKAAKFGTDVRQNGAGGQNWTERLPVRFRWLVAA